MALSHAIMTALLDEDLSGYDLTRKFETSLGFFWAASHQQIYQTLKKLDAEGAVSARAVAQDGRPDKIVYALTPRGHQLLDAWIREESRARPAKDDLFVKLYNVGHTDPAPIEAEIRARHAEHGRRLALYEKIRDRHYAQPRQLPDARKGIYLALSAGIRQERMFIDWCEEALALLATLPQADSEAATTVDADSSRRRTGPKRSG
ncbi:MAG: PadR family transcriptional regulator [Pseudomonadales bacterium]|jgi:DNA-binding PadR family transcriptional regulator|nr:PadR family transcriptional regulator [Pseudomonadales bacterium]